MEVFVSLEAGFSDRITDRGKGCSIVEIKSSALKS